MQIKDIVNRDIVTLTNCEHEPIHIPGSIQPHGFLLGITTDTYTIDFCSGNLIDYLDINYTSVLGVTVADAFGIDKHNTLENYINSKETVLPLEIVLNEKPFRIFVHQSGPVYVVEAEVYFINTDKLDDVYKQTSQFVAYMNNTTTLQQLCAIVATGTRNITGYDRVMIYRFDPDYNGEIVAESCREDLEPFLGLHYPQSDIPVQARELYMRNLMRMIVDVNYTPVPIYTVDDGWDKNLDLSLSVLRSTSPIHVEYLTNMGVGATLTISLMYKDKLWGLIACHHYSPKNITPEIRLAAQLQGSFITSQIDVRQSREEYNVVRKSNIALEMLNSRELPPVPESFRTISQSPELLDLCNAAGVSVLVSGTVYKSGFTPSDKDILFYSGWLAAYSNDTTFYTNKILSFVPYVQRKKDAVCGIIYHSLGNGNSIMWYKPETPTEVSWGGDPEKAIVLDSNGMHPRNSFNLWKEIVKGKSSLWLQPELNAAASYAHALQKQISMILLTGEEEKYRILSTVLKETNDELENINWISSHDLQEPLRKIQMMTSREISIQANIPESNVLETLNKVNGSAQRMQTLLADILKYTRVKQTQDAFENINLEDVMKQALTEMTDVIADNNAVITYDALPKIVGIPFLLQQLFSNILRNSIKYASKERTPAIHVTASVVPEIKAEVNSNYCHWVTFTDNGIGFEQKYAESIFNIFTRLHARGKYEGSGVGLALCKKIMQTNNGSIRAVGVPGKGAAITIYFPYDNN